MCWLSYASLRYAVNLLRSSARYFSPMDSEDFYSLRDKKVKFCTGIVKDYLRLNFRCFFIYRFEED